MFSQVRISRSRENILDLWNRKVSHALSFISIATLTLAMTACNSPDMNGTDFNSPAYTASSTTPSTSGSGASVQQSNIGNTLVLVSGDQQTGTPGSMLASPIVAKVLDPNGVPVVGAYVLVTVASGGGTVSNPTPISDANGEVVFEWTLGTALSQDILNLSVYSDLWVTNPDLTLTAGRIVGGESVGNSTIVGSGPVIADGVSTSHITITLLDSNNQALTGVVPTFTATGTNTYFPCTAVNSSGVSHCLMTSAQPGLKSLSVTGPIAFPGGSVQFNPGSPKYLTISGDNGSLLSVVVKDAFNNVIPNQEIDWSVTFGGGTLSSASINTDSTGTASNTYTSASSGTQSITASVHGYTTQVPSVTFILNYGVWTFQSGTASSAYILGNNIDFSSTNVCELTPGNLPDNSLAAFNLGTATGLTYGTLADGVSKGFKLGAATAGACDGSLYDCDPNAEFNANWTPEWNHILAVWHLDESAGSSVVDASGLGNGGPTGATQGIPGKLNNAVGFHGGYCGLTTGSTNFPSGASPRSISFWVNPINDYVNPVFSYGTSVNNESFNIFTYQGEVFFSAQTGYGAYDYVVPGVPFNAWTHVVLTYDGAHFIFYVNGLASASYSATLATVNGINSYIGSYLCQYASDGESVDEIGFWGTALSPAEVSTIYAHQSPTHVGYFTSRVMDAFTPTATWTSLSWLPTLPFYKALPGNGSSETISTYSSLANSTLMSGVKALWHFDEAVGAAALVDSSGLANNATPYGGVALGATGRFGSAASFDGSTGYMLGGSNGFSNFTNGITISSWVKLNSTSGTLTILDAGQGCGGCADIVLSINNTINYYVWGSSGNGVGFNSPTLISANTWHHIAVTEDGTGATNMYLDGVNVGTGTASVPTNVARANVNIGKSNWGATNFFNGAMDELAVWARPLSATEVQQLYQRGASRVKFQVQSCALPDCSDGTFQGPDGTSATYFTELDNTATYNKATNAPTGAVNLTAPSFAFASFATPTPAPNRYFQYRAIFESDATSTALMPEVKSITIAPNHYDATSPTVIGLGGVASPVLTSFTQTLGSNGCNTATYNLGIGASAATATWYYWNAGISAWAVANGLTGNSNLASVVNANLGSFPSVGTDTVYFKAFLNSDGSTPCELSEVQLNGHN